MEEKTLKFSNIKINRKELHKSKQAIDLDSVTTDRIVVSDKFRDSEVLKVEVVKVISIILVIKKMKFLTPLCIILPQMNGYITCPF